MHRNWLSTILLTFCVLMFSLTGFAQSKKTIESFQGVSNGAFPNSNLLPDGSGGFYGLTSSGGPAGCGTFFRLTQAAGVWTETVLYGFQQPTDACGPNYDLIQDSAGNIYGASEGGGTSTHGTVFELSPPAQSGGDWTISILYNFTGGVDGSTPEGGVAFGPNGGLYGITFEGGPSSDECDFNCGVLFQILPPSESGGAWTDNTLYSFLYPQQPGELHVIADQHGNLFGTNTSLHTIFKLSSESNGKWSYTDIYKFTGGSDGILAPAGLVINSAGDLYGTAVSSSGGTVFRLVPPVSGSTWAFNLLYTFTGAPNDGFDPNTRLIFDSQGNLYGTTFYGGFSNRSCQSSCGTVFKLSPSSGGTWTETLLHKFIGGNDGNQPNARLTLYGGVLYGTTQFGGAAGYGTVFGIRP